MLELKSDIVNILQKYGIELDVKKASDVTGKDKVKPKDILGGSDKLVNNFPEIFPFVGTTDEDGNQTFLG